MNSFYNEIVDTKVDLNTTFIKKSSEYTTEDWQQLQDEFHTQIEENYPTMQCHINEQFAEERNPIPNRLAKRIQVAAVLLNLLALGGKYSRKLYLETLDFCTKNSVRNGSLV